MKVLHLTSHINIGGITTYISKVTPALKQIGVETFVVSGGGNCKEDLEKQGAGVFELNIKTKNELHPKIYFAIPALEKIVQENGIGLLHAHSRITQVMAAVLSKKIGIPTVTTCHGYFTRRLGRKIFPAWGDLTIAISQGVADHLIDDFKVPQERVLTVSNAVDLEALDAAYISHDSDETKKSYGFKPGAPVLGIVARLVADKGHEYLLRAVPSLLNDFPEMRVLIVGDGRHLKYLQQLSKELGIKERVVFTGNVLDVTQALAAIDIFCLPATWREGFGLSIVEAMACRKPVIASNIWAINSLIQNGVTGILVEPKQTAPLSAAIKFLLKSPAEKQKITIAARKMVDDHFTIQRMAKELKSVYERAVQMRPGYRQSSCPAPMRRTAV